MMPWKAVASSTMTESRVDIMTRSFWVAAISGMSARYGDIMTVNDIQKNVRELAEKGIGVLITDHNVRETLNICERAYIVSDGRVICEGSPEAVLANEKVRTVYLGEEFIL